MVHENEFEKLCRDHGCVHHVINVHREELVQDDREHQVPVDQVERPKHDPD